MKYFFDTSAFVKFYRNEIGSNRVNDIILNLDNTILIMEFVKLEFSSSIFRRCRANEITEFEADFVIKMFNEDLNNFEIGPLTSEIVTEATRLLSIYGKNYGLRTLDALHLASCYLLTRMSFYDIHYKMSAY